MRTSQADRPCPAGLGKRLLLALALCACGGGGESADGTGGAAGATAKTTQAADASLASNTACNAPVPTYSRGLLAGPWQTVLDSLAANGVTFDSIPGNDTIGVVALCHNCTKVRVEIRASSVTPCLQPGNLRGPNRHIAGLFVLHDDFPAQKGWDALQAGDSILVFAHLKAGAATMIYNKNGTSTRAPHTSWQFWYCEHDPDSASGPAGTPQAQWRSRTGSTANPGGEEDDDEEGDGDNYGWMACASGCCQFYTPPPNAGIIETPEHADDAARDTVGQPRKPTWCHGT